MKKYILTFIIIAGICVKNCTAQTVPVTDTLQYLQTLVNNKADYIGQPFSKLLDSLQIQIKCFSPITDIPHYKNKETATSFGFYLSQTPDDFYLSYPRLRISWQPYLDATLSDVLWRNNNGGGWSPSVEAFYTTAIITDIKIRE